MINYKSKYKSAKAHNDELTKEIEKLKAEITELRWQNESLWIENRRLVKIKDIVFEAGCFIARELMNLKGVQEG